MLCRLNTSKNTRTRILRKNPQLSGVVQQVRIQTPRKPNSARRNVLKLKLSIKLNSLTYVSGGQHSLKKHSNVLVRGGGARDLPGVYTTAVRGQKDLKGIGAKTRRRSIYGAKKL